jgi:DNA polymerase-3 subunit alpha
MKALLLDTETTGLIFNHSITLDQQPEVIEFYGCVADLKKGKISHDLNTLIKPKNYPMTDEIIAETKTKLSNEMLADAPLFKEEAPGIKKLIENAPIVIAHNASFDKEMLDIEYERLGMKLKWPPLICTIEQTIHIKGYRLSLTNLHIELFKEPFPEAHRAKADVMALLRICKELYKRKLL